MSNEQSVSRHYTHGRLEQAILDALAASGKDPNSLTPSDLSAVDEFHIGGRPATVDLGAQLDLAPHMHVLDIGCGIGGSSRTVTQEYGCRVIGIDLTDEYVQVAGALSQRTGLADRVSYRQGSALALPFAAGTFDGAYMLHVGMNIADKAKLFSEVRRVLRPAALFGIYDVMREGAGEIRFPVPWAGSPEMSFVETAAAYRTLLAAAGFEVMKERSRRQFAIEFFRQLRARMAASGSPTLGLQIVMGSTASEKVANMVSLLESGVISPTELIARAS
jgi:ubiquinone/menaquinone biosynthesis C-methylase UbiE